MPSCAGRVVLFPLSYELVGEWTVARDGCVVSGAEDPYSRWNTCVCQRASHWQSCIAADAMRSFRGTTPRVGRACNQTLCRAIFDSSP